MQSLYTETFTLKLNVETLNVIVHALYNVHRMRQM